MPPKAELAGKRYGKLTVLSENGRDKFGKTLWDCRCECGKEITVIGDGLTRGFTKGCLDCKLENLVGQKFGKLTVIEKTEKYKGHSKYKCVCDCGKETIAISNNLKRGKTQSCGCGEVENRKANWDKFRTHGLRNHPLHETWTRMKGRCYNKKNEKYKDYGGRGIYVCEEWKKDFKSFYDWSIENGWQEGLTIDRRNNDGIYEPANCRWVPNEVQANNKRTNVFITYQGEVKTIAQWAKHFNIGASLISQRLKRNLSLDAVFMTTKYKRVG